jgi:hypothetical protein
MRSIDQGEKIFSFILVLPKFKRNQDYDTFVGEVKRIVIANLLLTPDLKAIAVSLMRKGCRARKIPSKEIELLVDLAKSDPGLFAQRIVEGILGIVYFYGQELSAQDLRGMESDRGPVERQKFLSRAPYYLIQVVNSLLVNELASGLNRQKLFAANTQRAEEFTPAQLDAKMREFKNAE